MLVVLVGALAPTAGSLASPAAGADPAARAPMCLGLEATIVGAGVIKGTAGDDVIVGSGGNDTIKGLAGHDRICGGGGNDTIVGGMGRDQVQGGPGNDTI
ncbi:MAG TPA: hypothetical protein VLS92_10800, partial [Acidimicrobiia bacterium]|nr:hypothetical protein [Acidimicrobiia bacterium]